VKLGMMYHLRGICPRTDQSLGRCGFSILLYPAWRAAVEKSGLTQQIVSGVIQTYHRYWLDGCGYNAMFDPDQSPMAKWEERNLGKTPKLGPNARPLYGPHEIRVAWGEWGPEHISVPGNACGLDIDDSIGAPRGGRELTPHNIDSFGQVMLLLTVFTFFADHVIAAAEEAKQAQKLTKETK
jgi:hypothetical protein